MRSFRRDDLVPCNIVDAQTATDDIFRLLNEAPEALLQVQWVALDERIESLLDQERRIAAERDELTKQQNVLTAIAKYRGIELSRAARNAAVHGRPNPNTSAPKQAVQLLLDEGPDATWDARSVHDAITDAGVETSRENVRIILQRLAKDGSIRRVAHGRYQSALAPGEHTLLEDDESKEGDVREPLLR
jgi:hypothetical protein